MIEYKSNGDKDKTLSIKSYLYEIKPYLSDMINNHKTQGECKIHLTMAINVFSSKDSEEIRTMRSTSDNMEIILKQMKLLKTFLIRFYKDIKKD